MPREYEVVIKDELRKGLRRDFRAGRNLGEALYCLNARVTEFGITSPMSITSPFATPPMRSGVFPQMFLGTEVNLLAYENELRIIDTFMWNYSLHVQTFDPADREKVKAIPSGGSLWHFAELGSSWFLFNEACTLFKTGREEMAGNASKVYVNTKTKMTTGCAHPGRLVFGGFEPGWFWSDEWNAQWNEWWENTSAASLGSPRAELPENFVGWTSIGAEDLWFWLDKTYAEQGPVEEITYDSAARDAFYLSVLKRNELGFVPMPWSGAVLVVKKLGDNVIVYGEQGISMLFPVTSPFPTFGVKHLLSVGIQGRGAVGGDESQHICIDNSGCVWRLRADSPVERLGYEEFFVSFLSNSFIVNYNPHLQDFYITIVGDSLIASRLFTLTKFGLSYGLTPLITSGQFHSGAYIGVFETVDYNPDFLLILDQMDFGTRKPKTLTRLEVGYDAATDATLYVGADYRHSGSDSFTTGSYYKAAPDGSVVLDVPGVEFKLKVRIDDYTGIKLDYIKAFFTIEKG